jgi:acetyl-CoA synthetase
MEGRSEVLLKVEGKYYPPKEIVERAWVKDYESLYQESIKDREGFWAKVAEELH